jgi:hypothetical protein
LHRQLLQCPFPGTIFNWACWRNDPKDASIIIIIIIVAYFNAPWGAFNARHTSKKVGRRIAHRFWCKVLTFGWIAATTQGYRVAKKRQAK